MPLRTTRALLTCCLLLTGVTAKAEVRPQFDVRALDALWPVIETLERDLEPTVEMWDALFDTPGYEALAQAGMAPNYFERVMHLAYRPSMWQQRDAGLGHPELGPVLQHFLLCAERREEVDRDVRALARTGLPAATLGSLASLLPKQLPAGQPRVAVALWANAGRGGDPLVIDVLAVASWDVQSYLGHELHHWYRDRLLAYDREAVADDDAALVAWLESLQAEGIADQIDKHPWVLDPARVEPARREYMDRFLAELGSTDDAVDALDQGLVAWQAATDPAQKRQALGNLPQRLTMGGHPLGYRMTRTILDAFGEARLVAVVGNPFAFARLYDEAARARGGTRPLSPEAVQALRTLEQQYVRAGR